MTPRRLAPLSVIAFIILNVLSGPVLGDGTNVPKLTSAGPSTAAFYAAHHGDQVASAILLGISVVAAVIFVLCCRALLAGETLIWPSLLVAGVVIAGAGELVVVGNHVALADAGRDRLAAAAVQALNAFDVTVAPIAFGMGFGIMLLGAAGTMVPHRGWVRRLGWLALPIAVPCFVGAGLYVFPLIVLWMLGVGVLLYRRTPEQRPVAGAQALVATA